MLYKIFNILLNRILIIIINLLNHFKLSYKLLKTSNNKGQTTIFMILIIVILLITSGLAIDVLSIYYTQQNIQNVADIVALAAVNEIENSHGQVESTSIAYARKNGINANDLTIIHPYNEDNDKVGIIINKTVNLNFLPIIGYKTKSLSVKSVAKLNRLIDSYIQFTAFNYAIFNGGDLDALEIKGNGSDVNGNVHSNSSIVVHGNKHTIDGDVTAVGTIDLGKAKVPNDHTVTQYSEYVEMPYFDFNVFASYADTVYDGNVTLNGDINLDGITLINGDCHITGMRVSGKGIILATGDIQISGSIQYNTLPIIVFGTGVTGVTDGTGGTGVTDGTGGTGYTIVNYDTYGDLLSLYSLKDIRISGADSLVNGALYAPNGSIRIDGSGNTVNGSLIAQEVIWAAFETTVNANYDIRMPEAFKIEKTKSSLVE